MSSGRVRLTIFIAAVVLLPALVSHLIPVRRDFDPKPIAHLRKKQPDVVMIGDSVLGGSINPELFAKESGVRTVELLWNGGAASAAWYLLLKNYVVTAGIHPQLVCIFFRERMLTDATFRTTPTYRRYLESLRHPKEPVYRTLVQGDGDDDSALGRLVDWLYPLNTPTACAAGEDQSGRVRIAAGGSGSGRCGGGLTRSSTR